MANPARRLYDAGVQLDLGQATSGGMIMERTLRARMFGLCGAAALALSAGGALVASGAAAVAPEKLDITICHASASEVNPYIVESPANEGVLDGHYDHTGPIFNPADPQPGWGDIIPPTESH